MATLKQAYNNWSELLKMVEILAVDAMQDSAEEAENLNREQLYDFGVKASGELLPDYKLSTIRYKQRKGQIYDHMTLRDTGAFHKSFSLKRDKDSVEMLASDAKTGELMKRYGKDILGLTDGSKVVYFGMVRPVFFKKVRKILGYGR